MLSRLVIINCVINDAPMRVLMIVKKNLDRSSHLEMIVDVLVSKKKSKCISEETESTKTACKY